MVLAVICCVYQKRTPSDAESEGALPKRFITRLLQYRTLRSAARRDLLGGGRNRCVAPFPGPGLNLPARRYGSQHPALPSCLLQPPAGTLKTTCRQRHILGIFNPARAHESSSRISLYPPLCPGISTPQSTHTPGGGTFDTQYPPADPRTPYI